MVGTVTWETKRECQRKAKRRIAHMKEKEGDKNGRPKKGQKTNSPHERKRGRTNPFCGRKLSHPQPL